MERKKNDMQSLKIKICGLTNLEDALLAAELGADALGFIFSESKRTMTPEAVREIVRALPPYVISVGVFMDQLLDEVQRIVTYTGLDRVQLHGHESLDDCRRLDRPVVKRIFIQPGDTAETIQARMAAYPDLGYLIDPGAGDGKVFDWNMIRGLDRKYILAGGLNPGNVRQAVELLHPYGVDVSSGVEFEPRKKDPDKLKRFIEEARCL